MSQELRDLFEGTRFTLDESKAKKFEGILATVKGPFGMTEGENRNGRVYTNDFWEHVLAKDENLKRLKERAVIGELEHPNSVQTKLGEVSHVVTELLVKPDQKELYGEADILDTPSGRILHTLFRAGVKVGISSRGAGSLEEGKLQDGKKGKFVKKEDYVFGGFDFVSDPSAPNAYPRLGEGQIAKLTESLAPHAEQIQRNVKFYEPFLKGLGITRFQQESKVEVLSKDTAFDEATDLDEKEATIADLRSKMRQMVESHRDMSSRLAEMQERLEKEENLRLRCDILSEATRVQKAKTLQLGQQMDEVSSELVQARKRLDEFRDKDVEGARGVVLREQKFSKDVTSLEQRLQEAQRETTAQIERVKSLETSLQSVKGLAEKKTGKLENFRRELLGALSEQFDCDLKALTEGLTPGFTPQDAVRRAAECSRSFNTKTLPLGEGLRFVSDDSPGSEDKTKTVLKERRKDILRGARGRRN